MGASPRVFRQVGTDGAVFSPWLGSDRRLVAGESEGNFAAGVKPCVRLTSQWRGPLARIRSPRPLNVSGRLICAAQFMDVVRVRTERPDFLILCGKSHDDGRR